MSLLIPVNTYRRNTACHFCSLSPPVTQPLDGARLNNTSACKHISRVTRAGEGDKKRATVFWHAVGHDIYQTFENVESSRGRKSKRTSEKKWVAWYACRSTRILARATSELSSLWMAVRKGTSWDGEREKGERIGGKDERVKSNRRKNLRRGIYLLSFLFFRKNIQKNRLLRTLNLFPPLLKQKLEIRKVKEEENLHAIWNFHAFVIRI